MKKISSLLAAVALFSAAATAQNYTVTSPDGNIKAVVTLADGITYDVYHGNDLVLDDCRMSMKIKLFSFHKAREQVKSLGK